MNTHRSPALPFLLLLAACGPMPGESAGDSSSTSDSPTSTGGSTGDDRPGPSGEASSSPTTGSSGTGSGTSTTSTTDPANVTSETSTSTGEAGGGTASSSTGGSSTGGSSESGGDSTSTGDTPEVVPLCFGDPCDTLCGPGLVCLPHPTTGEGMCVTQCLASPTCDGVVSALCGEGPTLKVPNTACIFNACFPRTCAALADCPNTSTECTKGICY